MIVAGGGAGGLFFVFLILVFWGIGSVIFIGFGEENIYVLA